MRREKKRCSSKSKQYVFKKKLEGLTLMHCACIAKVSRSSCGQKGN